MTYETAPVSRTIRREILVVLAIALLCAGLYSIISPFLVPLAWAIVVTLSTWPLYARLERKIPNRPTLTALLMTSGVALVLILLIVPLALTFGEELEGSVTSVRESLESNELHPPSFLRSIPIFGVQMYQYLDLLLHNRASLTELWSQYQPQIVQAATWFAAGAFGFFANLIITLLIVFFLFSQGRRLEKEVSKALYAIGGPRSQQFSETFRGTVRGTVYGVLLTALAQGVLAGFGFAVVGAPFPVLLGFATFVLSLVPFGPPFLYLPVAGWLLMMEVSVWKPVFIVAWGVGVVSMADNVLRPLFISQATNMPILLVLFSVIGGILQFGLIGLFLGPVLVALALTLWREWLGKEGAHPRGASAS